MPSPFPGMDPYLESPDIWHNVHVGLIYQIQVALASQIAPRYYVRVEERAYIAPVEPKSLIGLPDVVVIHKGQEETQPYTALATPTLVRPVKVQLPIKEEVKERWLEIRTADNHEVVTVIEVLSPSNKRRGKGRDEYLQKRDDVLSSSASLVEIDLLRDGDPMPLATRVKPSHYRILISRPWERPSAELYSFNLNQEIPEISVPLRQGEKEPTVNLKALLSQLYDQARYDLSMDYAEQPEPPLEGDWAKWAESVLAANINSQK